MRVVVSLFGLEDLREIIEFIAANNRAAAHKLVEDLEVFCRETIVSNPKIGKAADDLMPGLRVAAKRNYRICYRVSEGTIEIARFAHGARDLAALFSR